MATLNGGRGWASDACAASVHRLDSAFGRILPIASAGRSWDEQNRAYQLYKSGRGPLALPPGTSVHESGNAIDWGNAVYSLLNLYAGTGWRGLAINDHGHRRTVSSEVWHTEYDPSRDNHRGGGGGGSYAASVTDIQTLANKLGATLAVDGDYGPATAGWVRAFQGDHGLTVDGIVGPQTWGKMQEVYAASQNRDTANRQAWLNAARGENLTVDNQQGPATTEAIKRYQTFLGVAADGQWGPGTQAAHQAYYDAIQPYMQYGGTPWVEAIQDKLARLGYGIAKDGYPGAATQAAVKDFQSKNGITADGIAGPITNNKMDDLLTAPPVGRNATTRPTVEIQNYLISKGYDLGSFGADGDYGAATTAAVLKYQKDNGLEADGVWGPASDAKAFPPASTGENRTTRSTWDIQRLVGADPVDGIWGPNTTEKVKAWQAANGLEADGIWGPASDAKGFPSTPVSNYPTNGRNATTRPTEDIQKLVGAEVDGSYGPNTSVKVAQWQEKNGLTPVDGIWGPQSDAKGFPGVPLPDAPADPTKDPLYGKKKPLYPDAVWADVSPNKSVREGDVKLFIVHHVASAGSSVQGDRDRFMKPNDRNVSPNWLVQRDGGVSEIVPPDDYRAWTTGAVDHQAVTVETQNTSGDPTWGISDESHEAIAQLIAWSAHRYGFPIQKGAVSLDSSGKNVVTVPGIVGHRDTPAGKSTGTLCPGPAMKMDWLITRAGAIYAEKYAPQPEPEQPTEPEVPTDKILVDRAFLENLKAELEASAQAVGEILD